MLNQIGSRFHPYLRLVFTAFNFLPNLQVKRIMSHITLSYFLRLLLLLFDLLDPLHDLFIDFLLSLLFFPLS